MNKKDFVCGLFVDNFYIYIFAVFALRNGRKKIFTVGVDKLVCCGGWALFFNRLAFQN